MNVVSVFGSIGRCRDERMRNDNNIRITRSGRENGRQDWNQCRIRVACCNCKNGSPKRKRSTFCFEQRRRLKNDDQHDDVEAHKLVCRGIQDVVHCFAFQYAHIVNPILCPRRRFRHFALFVPSNIRKKVGGLDKARVPLRRCGVVLKACRRQGYCTVTPARRDFMNFGLIFSMMIGQLMTKKYLDRLQSLLFFHHFQRSVSFSVFHITSLLELIFLIF